MKIFAAFSAVALAQDMRMMSSHERLDSVRSQKLQQQLNYN